MWYKTAVSGEPPVRRLQPIDRGTVVGRYVVLSKLGSGAMGAVYSALDPDLDRRVALKIVAPRAYERPADLSREARVLAKLEHPNVATVFDVGFWDERLFIAMELVDGGDLDAWLSVAREPREILSVFVQAGRGLAAAHDRGIVHRDVKPTNVLVGTDGRARVADFGLARLAMDDATELDAGDSMRGLVASRTSRAGTPSFMAPEVTEGAAADARSDQYSFCVALHWALGGTRPSVDSDASGLPVPAAIRSAIARGLRTDPAERHPSMDALLGVIEASLERRRSLFLAGAGVGIIGGVVVALAATGTLSTEDRCRVARMQWSASVDPARVQAMRARLAEAEVSYAEQTADRVVDALGRYEHAWKDELGRACVDPRREGETACLGERRREVEALLGALEQGGPEVVESALSAVARLRPPGSCVDLGGWPASPYARASSDDESVGEAIRGSVRQAEAFEHTGQFARSLEQARAARDRARELGHPLLAEALLAVGTAHYRLGQFDAAESALREAITTAWAQGDDARVIEAAAQLVHVVGVESSDEATGQIWLELGEASVTRLGVPSLAEADLHDSAGTFSSSHGHWAQAREHHERGLALRRQFLDERHPAVALSLFNLAGVDLEEGRFEEGLARSREALALHRAAYGDRHPDVAGARNTLGAALTQAGRIDEAREELDTALALGLEVLSPRHPRLSFIRNNLAGVLNRQGEHARAQALYLDALEAWQSERGEDDPKVGVGHHNVAATAQRRGDYETAQIHYRHAIRIWTAALGPEHPKVASGLHGLSTVLVAERACVEAASHARRAVAIAEGSQESSARILPATLHVLSRALTCTGELESAEAAARQAVEYGRQSYGRAHRSLAPLRTNLAEVQLRRGREAEAARTAEAALEVAAEPGHRALARFVLAQALVGTDPARARTLAETSLAELPADNPRWSRTRASLEEFLQAHPETE